MLAIHYSSADLFLLFICFNSATMEEQRGSSSNLLYVESRHIILINHIIRLFIVSGVFFSFFFFVLRFQWRRWAARAKRNTSVVRYTAHGEYQSRFDGICCACGGEADVLFVPCFHTVMCFSCSLDACTCPHCKVAVVERQRLLLVT